MARIDPLEYVRETYGVNARKGGIVAAPKNRAGVINGASGPHVKVRLCGERADSIYHPDDLTYLAESEVAASRRLRDACKAILECDVSGGGVMHAKAMARAAIAKAEGR